jgi:hypothetical protein
MARRKRRAFPVVHHSLAFPAIVVPCIVVAGEPRFPKE